MGRTQDILQATQMFSEGLKSYQVNSAFRDAADKFKQLDAQEEDIFKKRAAQEQMAKDLSSSLLGMGASPQQVTQGFQTYMPQAMTGSKDFLSAAANTPEGKDREALNMRGLELQKQEQKMTPYQSEQIKLGWGGLIGQQQDTANQQKALSAKDAMATDEATYRFKALKEKAAQLDEMVGKTGTFEAFGPEADRMKNLLYNMAVDHAKLVDPESVAREGEVNAAQKYILPINSWGGLGMTNATARTLIKDYMKDVDNRYRELKTSTKSGKVPAGTVLPPGSADISNLNTHLQYLIQNDGDPAQIERVRRAIELARSGK
jgi:hypothetical protein